MRSYWQVVFPFDDLRFALQRKLRRISGATVMLVLATAPGLMAMCVRVLSTQSMRRRHEHMHDEWLQHEPHHAVRFEAGCHYCRTRVMQHGVEIFDPAGGRTDDMRPTP
jgi:hypothetical protein